MCTFVDVRFCIKRLNVSLANLWRGIYVRSNKLFFFIPITNAMAAVEATDKNFDEVINTDKPVLVDFWAEWCGPCKMIAPIVEEIASEYDGKAVISKVDVDNNQDLSVKFGIRSIPTLLIFKNGEVVDKVVGATTKNLLTSKLDAHM